MGQSLYSNKIYTVTNLYKHYLYGNKIYTNITYTVLNFCMIII
jgi:hypothetical protein